MRYLILLLCLFLACLHPAQAQDTFDYSAFRTLPVLHDGRVKPLDSFARIYLEKFSGQESLDGKPATSWLAKTLFDPAAAASRPVFKIRRTEFLDLPASERNMYSYEQLSAALSEKKDVLQQLLNTPEKDWSDDQRALMELHEYSILYLQLLRSLSAVLPLTVTVPESLVQTWPLEEKGSYSFLDIAPYKDDLDKRIQTIVSRKGESPELYTDLEQQIVSLGFHLDLLERSARQNALFRIIPANGSEEWLSPWAYLNRNNSKAVKTDYLRLWQEMAGAYRGNETQSFHENALKAFQASASNAHAPGLDNKVTAEVLYNQLNLLTISMVFYIISLTLAGLYQTAQKPALYKLAYATLLCGVLLHLSGIILRIYILARPPVGTLYESVIFVSLICAAGALFFEMKSKNGLSLLTGAMVAAGLIAISKAFSIGDNLEVLIAVLNTNFWLATHVLCITIGYGWCVLAATTAHFYLFRRYFEPGAAPVQNLMSHIKTLGLLGLLFTTVGTILGGIWADQSWGRFWGWDPKENGALLIVLWLIWLLHGRIAGQIKPLTFAAGMAFLNIVVALAWFGVNLLNTGLHSYGFITGVAHALAAFCMTEILIISSLWFLIVRKERHAKT